MKKIKEGRAILKWRDKRKTINNLLDIMPFAWDFGMRVPGDKVQALTSEEVAEQYPHLMTLFLVHKGKIKSHEQIKHNAEVLLTFKVADLLAADEEEFIEAGLRI